eukprot:1160989-Pelagomonas_calceolata.AAC.10
MVGLMRRPAPAAVHEFVVQVSRSSFHGLPYYGQAPDGNSRTFRVATPTADVPAQQGERVTFVCSPGPNRGSSSSSSSGSGSNKLFLGGRCVRRCRLLCGICL